MRPWTELAKLIILNSAKYIDKNLSRQLMRDEGALTASLSQSAFTSAHPRKSTGEVVLFS